MTESTKVDRTCATCACCLIQTNPNNVEQKQTVCRRAPPIYQTVRVEIPMLDRNGKILTDRDGKPRMTDGQQIVSFYPPTAAGLTCFDGWRPIGTEPGAKWETDEYLRPFMSAFDEALARLKGDLIKDLNS